MTNNKFWSDDWMQLQQQYWQKLNEFGQQAVKSQQPQSPFDFQNWENAMQQWWKTISPAMPDANKSFVEKIIEQGSAFYRMNETLASNMDKTSDWSEMLNKTFEQLQSGFASQAEKATGSLEDGFNKMMGYWQSPLESWNQLGNSIDINNLFFKDSNMLEKMLNVPGLGYTREDEERYKQLMQSSLHYQHAMSDYNRFFSDMGTQSVSCMKDKVKAISDKGETIDSGRALYNLWVSACEEIYAKRTMTPEYAKVHGELVNAQMQLKKNWEDMVDMRLGRMNMPTRREIKTLQTRLQESRREIRSLRCDLTQLADEVAALKQQQLTPAAETSAPATAPAAESAAPAAKSAPRKKATRKKAAAKPAN